MGKTTKHRLDLRGSIVPLTLLKITQIFRTLKPGETMEVLWSEPDIPEDLFKVLPPASYELIAMEELGKVNHYYRFRIQKKEMETT